MIQLHHVYWFAGLLFLAYAAITLTAGGKRANAAFWALLGISMLAGDLLGDVGNGLLVLGLIGVATFGGLGRTSGDEVAPAVRQARADRYGGKLFLIALVIPAVALGGTLLIKAVPALADPRQATLISLALGVILALILGRVMLGAPATLPLRQGARLVNSVGWAAVLPQMLASLGAVFALAGVGEQVGGLIQMAIPEGSRVGAVIAYGLGMALFTMVMGNAFAAFPVMAAAIGVPLLIGHYHGNPAIIAAVGMLAGFCGTLMTPMAANFNLVPAALLELKDPYGVIRAQIWTALPLLAFNIALIALVAFP